MQFIVIYIADVCFIEVDEIYTTFDIQNLWISFYHNAFYSNWNTYLHRKYITPPHSKCIIICITVNKNVWKRHFTPRRIVNDIVMHFMLFNLTHDSLFPVDKDCSMPSMVIHTCIYILYFLHLLPPNHTHQCSF